MTPTEVGALLVYVSAYDNRNVTEETATAWAQVLDQRLTFKGAKWIVEQHYKESTEWLMPAHINLKYLKVREDRLKRVGTNIEIPHGLEADRHQEFLNAYHDAIANGAENDHEARELACHRIGHNPEPVKLVGPPPTLENFINKIKETQE